MNVTIGRAQWSYSFNFHNGGMGQAILAPHKDFGWSMREKVALQRVSGFERLLHNLCNLRDIYPFIVRCHCFWKVPLEL